MRGEQDSYYGQADDIDQRIMKIYLKELSALIKDIPFQQMKDGNEDKQICILCNRIAETVFYDINTSEQTQSCRYKSY